MDWLRRLGLWPGRGRIVLVLYQRRDCPLCHEMELEIERAALDPQVEVLRVDVDQDPELAQRFGLEVPVLEIDGRKAFVGALTAKALRAELRRARALLRREERVCRA